MPGATDEFYFFRRAAAALTNSAPTLLDAVFALTNQTYIRATCRRLSCSCTPPRTRWTLIAVIEDQRTADRIKRKHFEKHGVFNDRDWDYHPAHPGLRPRYPHPSRRRSHDSYHFFRHSFAEFDLNGWDALRAVALAGKTRFTVKKKWVVFRRRHPLRSARPARFDSRFSPARIAGDAARIRRRLQLGRQPHGREVILARFHRDRLLPFLVRRIRAVPAGISCRNGEGWHGLLRRISCAPRNG